MSITWEEIVRRRELTAKLRAGDITKDEAMELNQILEKELKEATEMGDVLAMFSTAYLLSYVLVVMEDRI